MLFDTNVRIPDGSTIIFEAPERRGKTMSMVAFELDSFQKGRNIFSNIQLAFPHEKLAFKELELQDNGEGQLLSPYWNGHIGIDELNFYFDARRSMSNSNVKFSTFLLQQKKQGCHLTGTTHDLYSLDSRIREKYDFLVTPTVIPAFPERPRLLRLEIRNGPVQARLYKRRTFPCNYLLGLYDTRAVYNPFAPEKPKEKPKQKLEPKPEPKIPWKIPEE